MRASTQDDHGDDDWVVSAPNGVLSVEEDVSRDGDEVSELLAGAILKHPESLRGMSKASQELKRPNATEFTFPSISMSSNGGGDDEVVVTDSERDVFQSEGIAQ